MGISDILGLLGGLALFLYGMQMMSDGLEDAAGNRMKQILEKLTANRILGVLVGAGITAVIQSSSATTVMVVGFVNSGMMTLRQAVWIIMGANIGTTITAQLITLDVGLLAPLFAFLGVLMLVFLKIPKIRHIGGIVAGFGILFIGMDMMSAAMKPLRDSELFIDLVSNFSNPLLGILFGAVFTAVIQSSSAAVGILQALSRTGVIPFSSAVFVLFGSNIGTCITAVLASIGTNRNAKRATIIHLLFNIIGTVAFTILCLSLPIAEIIGGLTPGVPDAQIANMHTTFNVVTTLLLLPVGTYLAKLAVKILPDSEKESGTPAVTALAAVFPRGRSNLGTSAVQTDLLRHEIARMVALAGENVHRGYQVVLDADPAAMKDVTEIEDMLDSMNKEISQYISNILVHNGNSQNVADIKEYFLITGNAERIGDHALNIGEYVEVIKRKNIVFSDTARIEIVQMQAILQKAIQKVLHMDKDITQWLSEIAAMEQQIDDMTVTYRERHLDRMHQGLCSEEACILYSEMLTDFERIGDHVLNIGQAYAKIHGIA